MSVIVAASSLTAIAPHLIDFTRAASAASELFRLMNRDSMINSLRWVVKDANESYRQCRVQPRLIQLPDASWHYSLG